MYRKTSIENITNLNVHQRIERSIIFFKVTHSAETILAIISDSSSGIKHLRLEFGIKMFQTVIHTGIKLQIAIDLTAFQSNFKIMIDEMIITIWPQSCHITSIDSGGGTYFLESNVVFIKNILAMTTFIPKFNHFSKLKTSVVQFRDKSLLGSLEFIKHDLL